MRCYLFLWPFLAMLPLSELIHARPVNSALLQRREPGSQDGSPQPMGIPTRHSNSPPPGGPASPSTASPNMPPASQQNATSLVPLFEALRFSPLPNPSSNANTPHTLNQNTPGLPQQGSTNINTPKPTPRKAKPPRQPRTKPAGVTKRAFTQPKPRTRIERSPSPPTEDLLVALPSIPKPIPQRTQNGEYWQELWSTYQTCLNSAIDQKLDWVEDSKRMQKLYTAKKLRQHGATVVKKLQEHIKQQIKQWRSLMMVDKATQDGFRSLETKMTNTLGQLDSLISDTDVGLTAARDGRYSEDLYNKQKHISRPLRIPLDFGKLKDHQILKRFAA